MDLAVDLDLQTSVASSAWATYCVYGWPIRSDASVHHGQECVGRSERASFCYTRWRSEHTVASLVDSGVSNSPQMGMLFSLMDSRVKPLDLYHQLSVHNAASLTHFKTPVIRRWTFTIMQYRRVLNNNCDHNFSRII